MEQIPAHSRIGEQDARRALDLSLASVTAQIEAAFAPARFERVMADFDPEATLTSQSPDLTHGDSLA